MKKSNQPAFPVPVAANEVGIYSSFDANGGESLSGLTKREYFAAKALAGLVVDPNMTNMDKAAELAVSAADALLAKLEK